MAGLRGFEPPTFGSGVPGPIRQAANHRMKTNGLYELSRDAELISGFPDAPLENRCDVELLSDIADILLLQ